MSRRRRQRAAATGRVEQSRLRAEAAAAGQPASLRQAAALAAAEPPRRPRWRFWVAAAVAGSWLWAGWQLYGPLVAGRFAPVPLAAAWTVAAVAARFAWRWREAVGRRVQLVAAATVLVVSALLVVGTATSVVVDGRVPAASSQTAQVAKLTEQIVADLEHIRSYDEMMRLDDSRARARARQFEAGSDTLEALAIEYRELADAGLPAEEFEPVVDQVAVAADFGARTLDGRSDLVVQYDARLEQKVTRWHTTYTEAWLRAGSGLADAAAVYGVTLVDPETDPVE